MPFPCPRLSGRLPSGAPLSLGLTLVGAAMTFRDLVPAWTPLRRRSLQSHQVRPVDAASHQKQEPPVGGLASWAARQGRLLLERLPL
mmetsp:Transcript_834/g.1913  ORF Transcript_834/g.1913 Transcript_834/m.1913 type:complete len:87 (-) Transcript_834:712-972(-)